jgi:hypothetical protein
VIAMMVWEQRWDDHFFFENIKIFQRGMESLFRQQGLRVAEDARVSEAIEREKRRNVARKLKDTLIEKYNKVIKDTILTIYANYKTEIERMIEICSEIKMCSNPIEYEKLKREMEKFRESLPRKDRELLLYEKTHGFGQGRIFPNRCWDNEVAQEWLVYWDVPVILGGTTLMEKWKASPSNGIPGISYHERKNNGTLEVAIDQDYKGENIWIDIPAMILDCHMWRQRFGLEHLDAIALHAK